MLCTLNISFAVSRACFLVAGTGNQRKNKSDKKDNSKLFHTGYYLIFFHKSKLFILNTIFVPKIKTKNN
jgi:hypothetical protein